MDELVDVLNTVVQKLKYFKLFQSNFLYKIKKIVLQNFVIANVSSLNKVVTVYFSVPPSANLHACQNILFRKRCAMESH